MYTQIGGTQRCCSTAAVINVWLHLYTTAEPINDRLYLHPTAASPTSLIAAGVSRFLLAIKILIKLLGTCWVTTSQWYVRRSWCMSVNSCWATRCTGRSLLLDTGLVNPALRSSCYCAYIQLLLCLHTAVSVLTCTFVLPSSPFAESILG